MIKVIGTAYPRQDFSMQEFMRYWLQVHAPISAQAPGIRGYVVSEVIRQLRGELRSSAFVEQWFDDEASFRRAADSPEAAVAWADVANYATTDGSFWMTKEHILIPPPRSQSGLLR